MSLNESIVEDAALEWFGELGYAVGHGPHLAPGEPAAERDSFSDVVLADRLRNAIRRLNRSIPEDAREEAFRRVLGVAVPSLVQSNHAFHRMVRDGVEVEYARPDGSVAGNLVRLVDFEDCMSRRICVDLYRQLIALRPEWAGAASDDAEAEKGKSCVVKIVMTGSADDGPDWQPHIRSKQARRALANRFKDSRDPFRIVIVRDMWLTGFDAPCLHAMYADKPMQGHGLMQAIARVNRVFRDKPGGLVVDYLGLADQLKHALATYTQGGGRGQPTYDMAQAIAILLEKHGIASDILHGFNWDNWTTGKAADRLRLIPAGQEHILSQDDGKKRFVQVVTELSQAFALCATSDEATAIRDDVSFFQTLQAALNKQASANPRSPEQIEAAVRQLVSKAIRACPQNSDQWLS